MKKLSAFQEIFVSLLIALFSILLFLAPSSVCGGNWPGDAIPICTAAGVQKSMNSIPDGSGGLIISWQDERNGSGESDIFAQRVDASGNILWASNGVLICDAPGSRFSVCLTSDGNGGAIIAWADSRLSPGNKIYAQKINFEGTVKWAANGIRISEASENQNTPKIVGDGSGGAIISWQDSRAGASNIDIYAQRIGSDGSLKWATTDVPVCTAANNQIDQQMVADIYGNVLIAWSDRRDAASEIYIQKLLVANGNAAFAADGLDVSNSPGFADLTPCVVPDGSNAIILTWICRDYTSAYIVAQKVNWDGTPQWGASGKWVSSISKDGYQAAVSDGAGGVIITWDDEREDVFYPWNIYAQRLDANGNILWGNDDVALCDIAGDQEAPMIAADGKGGAIVVWSDSRADQSSVYSQRIDANGHVKWLKDGYQVQSVEGSQYGVRLCADGKGGAYIVWSAEESDNDLYALKLFNTDFFFAEGYTGPGFQEYLCLGNPGSGTASAAVDFFLSDGSIHEYSCEIPAQSRFTVDVNKELDDYWLNYYKGDVSIQVSSANQIVVERPMYFDYGPGWTGGHDVLGATGTSTTWYFAEGYTGSGFDEYVCVLNPGDIQAEITFNFQTQEAGEQQRAGVVPGHSRSTFKVNELLGADYQTSLMLVSNQPVVAERSMYFNYNGEWTGGHCVMGSPSTTTECFFAEGTTRAGFHEWLTLQNPGPEDISIEAVYQLGLGQGDNVIKSYAVGAGRRATIFVADEVGVEKDVSISLSSSMPFLAERPMYFNYNGEWTGGHCVIGCSTIASEWFFAEGYTGDGFHEWLCLQNSGTEDASVQIVYLTQEAGALPPRTISVPAASRQTVFVNTDAGDGYQLSTRIVVTAGSRIVAERPMYFNYSGWTGGHDVMGFTP